MRARALVTAALGVALVALLAACPPRAATSQAAGGGGAGAGGRGGGGAGGAGGGGSAPIDVLWATRFGDAADQTGQDVRLDAAGDVLVAAAFEGSFPLAGETLTAADGADGLVLKLSPAGTPIWARALAGGLVTVTSIAVRADGQSLTAGRFRDTLQIGAGVSLSAGDSQRNAFVAALGGDGAPAWGAGFGYATGNGQRLATSIDIDSAGAAAVAGQFKGSLTLGDDMYASDPASAEDIFLARLDASGNVLWSHAFGGGSAETWARVAVHRGSGEIALLSQRCDEVSDGGTPCGGATLRRFDAAGGLLWSRSVDGSLTAIHQAAAISASGDAVIAGTFGGTFDAGCGEPSPAAKGSAIYIAAVRASGCAFARTFDGTGARNLDGLAAAPDGRLVAAGTFDGTLDLGGGAPALYAGSERAVYVVTLDAGGAVLSARSFPAVGFVTVGGVATNGSAAVVTGTFGGELHAGSKVLTSAGGSDAFVMALSL